MIKADLVSLDHGAEHEGKITAQTPMGSGQLVHSTTVGMYTVKLEERPVIAQVYSA